MYQIKQSTTSYELLFLMLDSVDHVTPKTGLSPTVTIRKPSGSFATPSGTVTEIANGWYKVAGNATDTNTLGPLLLHATGTGADPVDDRYEVVAYDPQDAVRQGLTGIPNAAAGASGGIPLSVDASGRVDVLKINGTSQTARDIGASVLLSNGTGTGQVKLASGYVAMTWADIAAPTTTLNLSGTTIKTATDVEADTADLQSRIPPSLSINGLMNADVIRWSGSTDPVGGLADFATNCYSIADQAVVKVTTTVNTTNAPTVGDFTNDMKASINAEVDTALGEYDGPTNTEMIARTLVSADYATATGVSAVETDTQNIQSRLPDSLTGDGNIKADMDKVTGSHPLNTGGKLWTLDGDGNAIASASALATIGTAVSGIVTTLAGMVAAVWEYATRTLTDKTGFALTSAYDPAKTAAQAGDAMTLAASEDVYPAELELTLDGVNSTDEYTVQWFKNTTPVLSGITVPTIRVIKRVNGTDLIATSVMTQVGTTGAYKYDAEDAERITAGEAVVVEVRATIDGSVRIWRELATRDAEVPA